MFYVGNYSIDIKFGGISIPVSPQMIQELTITQDIDRLLPTFKLVLKDATGVLGEIVPFDKNQNNITIEIARNQDLTEANEFSLKVERRETNIDKEYAVQGLLNIKGLLDPQRTRAVSGNTIKSALETLVADDLEISDTEIGSSLAYKKTLLQPNWTNAKFLIWLKNNIIGKTNESGYHCFIKNMASKPIFVFKSLDEILKSPVKYNFIVGPKAYKDFYPINSYKIFDDSSLLSAFSAKSQAYSYFDYDTGEYISNEIDISGCPSLAENHLVDDDSTIEGQTFNYKELGRSNDFTSDFAGRLSNLYYNKTTELIKMWASTWGMENIAPGDIVKVLFNEAMQRNGNLFIYQHSGYWMVKRVVHIITNSFMTNILLERSGIDTDIANSLTEVSKIARK